MRFSKRIFSNFSYTETFAGEAYTRFIEPHYLRGLESGIPMEELEVIMGEALDQFDPNGGKPPGAYFRDEVDKRISEMQHRE